MLKRFIQDADEFNAAGKASTNTPDVVGEFLINGGTGKEFLALLEGDKKRKASETALIFNSLEAIFSRFVILGFKCYIGGPYKSRIFTLCNWTESPVT